MVIPRRYRHQLARFATITAQTLPESHPLRLAAQAADADLTEETAEKFCRALHSALTERDAGLTPFLARYRDVFSALARAVAAGRA